MSQTRRLGQLHAAENWVDNYRYLVNADFKAYDFESLRSALLTYVRTNYPEDFNDFINSSEYVALIDAIAFVGQNLAFRNDLNLRETFLGTAEVRDNVLNIARQLGYKSYRNSNANGFLKITSVTTSQNIYDSNGVNLAGSTIVWGDPTNLDAAEQFIKVINEVLNKNSPFGQPSGVINDGGVTRHIYEIDQDSNRSMVETFDLWSRNDGSFPCELIPITADVQNQVATESVPNPYSQLSMLFNNDGSGYFSSSNGWFFLFKQGTLKFEDYQFEISTQNRVIDVSGQNINQNDIWVQSIDASGRILSNWTQVENSRSNNIVFNSINKNNRQIYEVVTRDNDQISIKFSDGVFGDIPMGNIRIWFRESANQNITFLPTDANGMRISLRYIDSRSESQDLTCTLQLINPAISTATETLSSIKMLASRSSSSQDRMITANDYNNYPQGKIGGVDKIKAVNRTHAGQSIYADFKDPTGTYRPTITFADDGFIYATTLLNEDTRPDDQGLDILFAWIQDLLLDRNLHQFYYKQYSPISTEQPLHWNTVASGNAVSHGYFTTELNGTPLRIGRGTTNLKLRTILKNTLIKSQDNKWFKILDVFKEGLGLADNEGNNIGLRANGQGSIFINDLTSNTLISSWFPTLRTVFTLPEKIEIIRELANHSLGFGLRYDQLYDQWKLIRLSNLDAQPTFSFAHAGDTTNQQLDGSWLMRFEFNSSTKLWTSIIRKEQIVFGSESQITFHNQRFGKSIDNQTNRIVSDSIKFLQVNTGLDADIEFDISTYFMLDDGRYDPKRVVLLLPGLSKNLVPDNPDMLTKLIGSNEIYLKKSAFIDAPGQYTLVPSLFSNTAIGPVTGRKQLKIQHNHSPLRETRINPTTTNFVDMFVLTSEYNAAIRNWLASGAAESDEPITENSYELQKLMSNILPNKSISDTLVFHPTKYKIIFGGSADIRNQVMIKVVKSDTTRISDSEIRLQVIEHINSYFDVDNWDFGETFFFTDMASWVHRKMSGAISSITLIPRKLGLTINDMFKIECEDDEIFISSATAKDVEVVNSSSIV